VCVLLKGRGLLLLLWGKSRDIAVDATTGSCFLSTPNNDNNNGNKNNNDYNNSHGKFNRKRVIDLSKWRRS